MAPRRDGAGTVPAGATGAGYASFTFTVNDGTDDSASAYTLTIDIAPASTGFKIEHRALGQGEDWVFELASWYGAALDATGDLD